ncbi:MAG TPA: PDZ domain-containing protein [Candidatus Didemnitutus sp.]|nr:PDZ domain-containing protein [Candidatus Didemnitutus sp.]
MRLFVFLVASLFAALRVAAADLPTLLDERLKSVVAIEFVVQTETERRPSTVLGTVVDNHGTVVLPGSAISPTTGLDQLKEFKAYRPNSDESFTAEYLGQDAYTGWHFVRVEEKMRKELVPVTRFVAKESHDAKLDDEIWGIGLRGRDEDFMPYVLSARIALITRLPNQTAITAQDVGGPGLPVFDRAGNFVGIAQNSFGQNFLMFSRNNNGSPILLVNVEESSVVTLAPDVLPNLDRVPKETSGRPIAWIGIYGLQPVDPDVARLLKLEKQSGVVLSDIMEGSPAAAAGLQDRDIILSLDGKALPRMKPDRVVIGYFGQEVLHHNPGDVISLLILRGTERKEIKVTLGTEPKMVREAQRRYFDHIGLTVREYLSLDSIVNRTKPTEHAGVVVHFLKPSGPAAAAGLRPDDWIREIDGVEVRGYDEAVAKLAAIEADTSRGEFVLLASRGGETQVLRVKLN